MLFQKFHILQILHIFRIKSLQKIHIAYDEGQNTQALCSVHHQFMQQQRYANCSLVLWKFIGIFKNDKAI